MRIDYTPGGGLLYVHLREGEVAATVEVEPDIYADLDAEGRPLGVEFLNPDDFLGIFRRRLAGTDRTVELPGGLVALVEEAVVRPEAAAIAP